MKESKFWKIVDSCNWPLCEIPKMKKSLLQRLSTVAGREFHDLFYQKRRELRIALCEYERRHRKRVNLGDDGLTDMLSHVIGLGKDEYQKSLEDPSRLFKRAERFDFVESFAYVVPWPDEYTKTLESFEDWIQENIESLSYPAHPKVQKEAKFLVDCHRDLLRGRDVKGFLAKRDEILNAHQRLVSVNRAIQGSRMNGYGFYGDDARYNEGLVESLLDDLEMYLI